MNFIADKKMPESMLNNLKKLGNVFLSAEVGVKDASINSHPDLQIHFISDTAAVVAPSVYTHYKNILPDNIDLKPGICDIGFTYPQNCAYNIVRLGETVICNTAFAEKTILDYYKKIGYRIINVKQGYTKCNICPVSDTEFITEDCGIYKTVGSVAKDIKIHLITPGSVRLNGFEYGFIGGASGICGDKILFCGNALRNSELKNLINEIHIKAVMLSDDDLYDFGSVISF